MPRVVIEREILHLFRLAASRLCSNEVPPLDHVSRHRVRDAARSDGCRFEHSESVSQTRVKRNGIDGIEKSGQWDYIVM